MPTSSGFARRARRDRRGRGVRGSVLPKTLPGARTSAQRFDETVLEAISRLESLVGDRLSPIEFGVEDVPPLTPFATLGVVDEVPLGHFVPAGQDWPARVVLYRRPIEGRCSDQTELALVVRTVLTEEIGKAFGLAPGEIDPDYPGN